MLSAQNTNTVPNLLGDLFQPSIAKHQIKDNTCIIGKRIPIGGKARGMVRLILVLLARLPTHKTKGSTPL